MTSAMAMAGVPRLDHVFVVVMENHGVAQIMQREDMPFIQSYARQANHAAQYFAVSHPSLGNYLALVGGSHFGVLNDNPPDWHSTACVPSLAPGMQARATASRVCPIAGSGTDGSAGAALVVGESIADQLVAAGLGWKTYQENLPASGADGVNWSNGVQTDASNMPSALALYAVKHNPFAYFASIQSAKLAANSLHNMLGFERLYLDLASGGVPNFSFIVPNQCHDQHGLGSNKAGYACTTDAGLASQADATVRTLVSAIKASPVWPRGHNAIVVVWDEDDSGAGANQVLAIVDTNYGTQGVVSNVKYNHFSLLKTLEAGFGLGYLNHAADKDVALMSDLFAPR
jgi:hypothetical protein